MNETNSTQTWRIATVWQGDWGPAPELFQSLHEWIDATGVHIVLRHFSLPVTDFQRDVAKPLQAWQPHGVVTRIAEWPTLERLRRVLPDLPFVSTVLTPPGMVNTCVMASIPEALTLALDHFRKQGTHALALYYSSSRHSMEHYLAVFRAQAPDGFTCVYLDEDQPHDEECRVDSPGNQGNRVYAEEPGSAGAERVRQWLQTLPKPVGVVTLEVGAATFLLEQCRSLGLRVPEDVQLIGVDDISACLSVEPHLTSLALPRARIGKAAMETMWHYLRSETPPPPPIVEVAGMTLVVRASTGRVSAGSAALDNALDLMKTQATRGLSAARMAKISGMGRSTLYRQFSATTGDSPARHLRKIRIEKACRLLRESKDSVTDIAAACGFSSIFSFSRSFRHETGMSPTAYRKKAQSEDKRR